MPAATLSSRRTAADRPMPLQSTPRAWCGWRTRKTTARTVASGAVTELASDGTIPQDFHHGRWDHEFPRTLRSTPLRTCGSPISTPLSGEQRRASRSWPGRPRAARALRSRRAPDTDWTQVFCLPYCAGRRSQRQHLGLEHGEPVAGDVLWHGGSHQDADAGDTAGAVGCDAPTRG